MKPEFEKFVKIELEKQEQYFIDQIARVLQENKGKKLGTLEKTKLDIIHAFVKEITIVHRARDMAEIWWKKIES